MTTMLPMGFRDDIRVSTTSFRPGALLITLEHGTQWGISALCVWGGLCRTLLGHLLCSSHQMENGCLQRSNPQPHHAPYPPGLYPRHFNTRTRPLPPSQFVYLPCLSFAPSFLFFKNTSLCLLQSKKQSLLIKPLDWWGCFISTSRAPGTALHSSCASLTGRNSIHRYYTEPNG